jgi:hypothetical protein
MIVPAVACPLHADWACSGAAPRSARFARHADRVLGATVVLAAVVQLAKLPQWCPELVRQPPVIHG